MRRILILMLCVFVFSCKNEKNPNIGKEDTINKEVNESISKNEKDNILKIVIDLKILEDNKIDVFYIGDNPDSGFSVDELVSKRVLGSSNFQKIELELPKDILPYSFRIDLGDNSKREETVVEIKSIKLTLNDNEIDIDNSTLDGFFQPNIYLERVNGGYLIKIVDNKFGPFLLSKPIIDK